ncbi:MAG TPA: LysR family transcriptional regulator [Polyangiaceae bacterium]|jgi:DNA-binding transcriptional LysR family regulator
MDAPPPTADALTLDQLHLFLAVVDAGSFSAAARSLRRAQSVVSYGIANLERQLGVTLFDRSSRTPALTAPGRELAADARAVVSQVDRLRARARGIKQGIEPHLGLAIDQLFPVPALVHALVAFRERFPTVAFDLHTEALGRVGELVLDGTCSVGIGPLFPQLPESVDRRPLANVTMVHVASPDHPLARRRGTIPVTEVKEHTQIVLADRSRLTGDWSIGVFSGRTWRVLDLGVKHALLRGGLGWGGMPLHVVAGDLARKKLVKLRLDVAGSPDFDIALHAMNRASDPPGPAGRWMLERLGTTCAGKG